MKLPVFYSPSGVLESLRNMSTDILHNVMLCKGLNRMGILGIE